MSVAADDIGGEHPAVVIERFADRQAERVELVHVMQELVDDHDVTARQLGQAVAVQRQEPHLRGYALQPSFGLGDPQEFTIEGNL